MSLKLTEGNRKWWILAAMTATISMTFIDITILPVALPTIHRSLNISEVALQWLINSYLLTLTVFLLAGGRIGDLFGHKKICQAGLAVFSISSALCAFSYNETWFIVSRALQGVGGALLLPTTSAILITAFPPQERGRAMGIYVSAGSVFLALGPVIGGLLSQYLSWRYIFWINLPIAAIGWILSIFCVPETEKHQEKFDFIGFVTLSLGITCLVVGLMQASDWGWSSPATIGTLTVGILLIALLIFIDRKIDHPFLDVTLFRNLSFTGAVLCIFSLQLLLMITVFWTLFFQEILGYAPATAGLIAIISNGPVLFMATFGGCLTDKFGPKVPAISGFCCVIFSLLWFVIFTPYQNFLLLIPALILFGCGVPMIFNPCTVTSMSEAPLKKRGAASGMSRTLRQLGSTFGMAIFGSLFLHREMTGFKTALLKNQETASLDPLQFEGLLSSTPAAVEAIHNLPPDIAAFVKTAFTAAYQSAFNGINLLAILFAIVGLLSAIFLLKANRAAWK